MNAVVNSLHILTFLLRAKYPLAHVNELINVFGSDIMIGYDIGCGFSSTVSKSVRVGPRVMERHVKFCVNAFHGHAHNRLCQLRWHSVFQEHVGLEDFECCERAFSDSNKVALCTRHSSKYRRRVAIVHHVNRWNDEKFCELGTFALA